MVLFQKEIMQCKDCPYCEVSVVKKNKRPDGWTEEHSYRCVDPGGPWRIIENCYTVPDWCPLEEIDR